MLAIASTIYWIVILTRAYNTFADGTGDLALYSYNLYFNIHYPNIANGLQFIVTSNHITPDMIFIMPIYYLYQHSIALIYVQTVVLCMSSFLVFYATRKLVKDSTLALLFSVAFLLNPGITGILAFDFHAEFLLVPTYILTFYFYMTSNKKLFALSFALLLGVMEIAPILSLTMGLGLLAYELSISKRTGNPIEKDKKHMIIALIAISIVAGVLYLIGIKYLLASYSTSNKLLPPPLQITTGSEIGLLSNLRSTVNGPIALLQKNVTIFEDPLWIYLFVLSMLIALFGFGLFTLRKIYVALIMLLPWIIGALTWSSSIHLLYTGYQYYSFVVGASFAFSIICAIIVLDELRERKTYAGKRKSLVYASVIGAALVLMTLSIILAAKPLTYLIEYSNPVPYALYNSTQIDPLIGMVPQNASVMTQEPISPHLAEREYMEATWSVETNGTYFIPDYILVSYDNATQVQTNRTYDFFDRSVNNYTYVLYARNGNARLYKRG